MRRYSIRQLAFVVALLGLAAAPAAGTRPYLVKDINQEQYPAFGSDIPRFLRLGDQVLFSVSDHLWRTDGTLGGTWPIAELPGVRPHFVGASATLAYFFLTHSTGGISLWRTDGTAEGTLQLAAHLWYRLPQAGLEPTTNQLFFAGLTAGSGSEPWVSDGTVSGTRLLRELEPGDEDLPPRSFQAAGGRMYFSSYFGELWVSNDNGTDAGTRPLRELVPGRQGEPLSEYWVEVADVTTGQSRVYRNPPGEICGRGDIRALPEQPVYPLAGHPGEDPFVDLAAEPALPSKSSGSEHGLHRRRSQRMGDCTQGEERLCLLDGRFAVEVAWRNPRNARTGTGQAVPLTDESGSFWYFTADNLELVVKLVDGRSVNGHFWVFYGALSDVEYTIQVTDTATGAIRRYTNSAGEICGQADIRGFADE